MSLASILIYVGIGIAAYFVATTIITLWMFIVIMKWKKRGITKKNAGPFRRAFLIVGVFFDGLYNYTSGALALLAFPRRGEVMFTYHLQRIMAADLFKTRMDRYRLHVASTYCFIIEKFDVKHCTK